MTTLVTGGAGFVGSNIAARLLAQGESVVIVDNFNDYYDPAIKRANIADLGKDAIVYEADIRDAALMARIFDEHGIGRVAHMAAMANVRYSAENGPLYADVNTMGTVLLMDLARRHDVEVFVLASTSSVYGHTQQLPFREDDTAVHPLAPYPASKRAAEIFAYTYYQLYQLNVSILRFFNVYGPNGRPDMMPLKAIDAILNKRLISLYDGGELARDWTYIEDIVDGVIAALYRPLGYEIFNLGFGAPITLNAFIQIYEELIGQDAISESVPSPLTEPRITYCDNTHARDLLGFNPQTPIHEGLAHTWNWYRQRHSI